MASKTSKQEAHALINYFLKKYNAMYRDNPPGLNRYTLVFGFEALFLDYGSRSKDIIDYYFNSYEVHDPKFFVQRYGDIAQSKEDDDEDARTREEIYNKTVKMVRESRKENT